jgi:cholesterol transport system auxiliary component
MSFHKPFARRAVAVVAAAVCTLAASCGMLSQPAPEKALFAIDPGEPPAAVASSAPRSKASTTMPGGAVLRVRRLRVASPYDGQEFVYRIKGDEFRSDYYNGFIAAPDQLLTGSLVAWVLRAGIFESVVDMSSGIPARYVLEGDVTALYGDYTDKAAPKAVMTVRVFLLDDADAGLRIIFQKEYNAAVPIDPGSAESLTKGLSHAFRQILEQMTADLRVRSSAGL